MGDVLTDDVTGLTNGTAYTFTVAATNSVGTGTASAPSNAVTPATLPGSPTDVAATAGGSSASLTWVAPASDGGAPITHYVITPYVGTTAQAPVTAGSGTTFDVTGLTNGTTYTFTVTATNSAGSGPASLPSNVVTPIITYVPGYWMVAKNGSIYAKGMVTPFGSPAAINSPIVGMVSDTDNLGYWLVASDGGVFNYGDVGFYGSHGGSHLNSPVVGSRPRPMTGATGWWARTAASSPTATPDSTAATGAPTSTARWWGSRPPPTAAATGWWLPTGETSPMATPRSTAATAASPQQPGGGNGSDERRSRLLAGGRGRRRLRLRRRPLRG